MTGTNLGIASLNATGTTSVGAITTSGTASQALTLNAPTLGAINAASMGAGNTLTVNVGGTVTTIGAITVDAPAPLSTAGLTLTGGGAVTNIGAIVVDGALTLPSLTTVKTASTISALTIGGGNTVGPGAAGSTIGLITIGNGAAAANSVTFTFATMNGKTNATADATLAVDFLAGVGPDITTLAAKTPGTTSAGVTAILV